MSTRRRRSTPDRLHAVATAVLAALAVLTTLTRPARADQTFYLDRLQIGGSPNDGIAVWRPRMVQRTVFFGQFALGYSLHPLRGGTVIWPGLRDPNDVPNPVSNQLATYLSAGVEILERASFAVTVPVTLWQNGENPCSVAAGANCQNTAIASTVANDARIDGRGIFYRDDNRRFHWAIVGSAWPGGGNAASFTTDNGTHGALGTLLELDLRSVAFAFNTGAHFRPNRGLNQLRIGNEWTWGFGAYIPLREDRVRLGAELFGSTGIGKVPDNRGEKVSTTFTGRNTPLEWLGILRFALDEQKAGWAAVAAGTRLSTGYGAPDLRILGMIGYSFALKDTDPNAPRKRYEFGREHEPKSVDTDKDGIPDDLDLCPTVPEDHQPPDESDGCPAPSDRDHDGIPDDSDKCPDEPEDKDGLDDLDGCPEDDFDKDGVPDVTDACPREPGEPNEDPKKNGCPQFIRHVEGSTEIQILKKVEFATGSASILPRSFPILDEVVRLLAANKDIARVSVEGHTDIRGGRDMNMKLSQARSESVMKYLTSHGVTATRLEAHGYGPDKPIDSNDTDEGRQRNRRVEFHIKEQTK